MSPRAAWRLETLGFEHVFDYVEGKADWLANGLPREGETATVPYAGELVDPDPPTCALDTPVAEVRERLEGSRYGFCLVVIDRRVVLGRVRRSALADAEDHATAGQVMEAGPSTVRFNTPAAELVERLAERDLETAIVTTPGGVLFGVFHREGAAARLERSA
jgi:Mg/Co/Ni transporter MgtE